MNRTSSLKAAENIERVVRPSRSELEGLIYEQRPVIVNGLFGGQPICRMSDAEEARARLAALRLRFRPEYSFNSFQAYRQGPGAGATEMTLAEYLDLKARQPETPLLCLEEPTPDALLTLFSLGDYAEINAADGDRVVSRCFVGHAGNSSNLHYDRDYHATLLYQVFGRKRVLLISPRESHKLRPVMNFSEYLLSNFSPSDVEAFVGYTNGYYAVLDAGEALLIPTAFWHHVEYADDAMSVNFKLRRHRYLRLLGGGLFHSNYVVQGLATKFLRREQVEAEHADAFDRILAVYTAGGLTPFEKFDALDELFRELYATLCADFPQRPYFSSMLGVKEADLWRGRLEGGSLYADPGAFRGVVAGEERSR